MSLLRVLFSRVAAGLSPLILALSWSLSSHLAQAQEPEPSVQACTDVTNEDLELYVCDNPACTTGTNQTLETAGDVGSYTSVAIGADGNPIISHHDNANEDLELMIPVFAVTGIAFE